MGDKSSKTKGLGALIPLILFIVVYFSLSLFLGDFYAVPILVVFIFSLFIAFVQYPKKKFVDKLQHFSKGSGDPNILVMILIFLLAGAFSEVSKSIGAISSTITFALTYLSPSFIVSGIFLISCFVSISLGTSVGTIVAIAPIAIGFEAHISGVTAMALAAVVGGAMFGDNLSFISDTTIAATRTQNVGMKEKFKVNFSIVMPVAILVFILYYFLGSSIVSNMDMIQVDDYNVVKILPYVLVFVLALCGIHVIWTLGIGIIFTSTIGILGGDITFLESVKAINTGFMGMFELSILCLIIGGIVGIIRYNGGIEYLLKVVLKNINSPKGAEFGIVSLTALVNLILANNTITILIVGPIAKDISDRFNLIPSRVSSLLDTASCFAQGIIPYGAQLLAAIAATAVVVSESGATVPSVSPLEIMQYLYYPYLTGVATILFVIFSKKKVLSARR